MAPASWVLRSRSTSRHWRRLPARGHGAVWRKRPAPVGARPTPRARRPRRTQLAPSEWRLAAEAVARLLDDEHPDDALRFLDGLPTDVRARSRMRLLEAWAAVGAGDTARAQAILDSGLEVPDLREGERSIDQLWAAAYPDRELPPMYDFRMVAAPSPNINNG